MTDAHPDDELLSAHLDGEAGTDIGPHLHSCAGCRRRLAELEGVAALVASVPDRAPGFLDAAIAAALEAHAPEPGLLDASVAAALAAPGTEARMVAAADRPSRADAGVVPLDGGRRRRPAGPGDPSPPLWRTGRASRRRRLPPLAWVATAAAAIALVAAVPLLLPDRSGDDGSNAALQAESSAGTDAARETAKTAAPAAGTTAGPAAAAPPSVAADAGTSTEYATAPAYAGDLGDQSDLDALAAAVDGGSVSSPLLRSGPDAVDGGSGAESGAPAGQEAAGAGATAPFDPSAPPCVGEARRIATDLGALVSVATVRWRGTAGVVLVFRLTEPAGGFERQLYVMARTGCALLAERRL